MIGKKFSKFNMFFAILFIVITTVSLGYNPIFVSAADNPVFTKSNITISIGETQPIIIRNTIKNSTNKWTSSNKAIVTVNNQGEITGISPGTAIVTCKINASKQKYVLSSNITVENVKKIPKSYTSQDNYKGTVERLDYTTKSYDADNKVLKKYLNVYLPYGYNPKDTKTKYNILYLMHGAKENQNTAFGVLNHNDILVKIIDNMIHNGDIDPLIIVTPTFYNSSNADVVSSADNFHNELVNDIMPAVEGKYKTYAKSTSSEDFIASRDHRAFGGFSMGGACTWSIYINCLNYFKYFMPLSGASWTLMLSNDKLSYQQTAEYLAKVAEDSGYTTNDYYIYCATGTTDLAYKDLTSQIAEMKKIPNRFVCSDDYTKGNLHLLLKYNGAHTWQYVNQYIYNLLPYLFKQ